MREISFSTYDRLVSDRPFKFEPEEVNYREGAGEELCKRCVHFFSRAVDGWTVCEILRDVKTDDEEDQIKANWVCDFWTSNNKDYPLYEGPKSTDTTSDEG